MFLFRFNADCPKVLTLYGMSNLVSESEHSLDLMDPYQRDAKTIGTFPFFYFLFFPSGKSIQRFSFEIFSVWEKIMRGEFKLPTKLTNGKPVKTPPKSSVAVDNDVYSSPYEVRVRPPPTFVAPPATSSSSSESSQQSEQNQQSPSGNSDEDSSSSKLTIIRFGRSLPKTTNINEKESLPLLSEQDAEMLSRLVI